jgi:hypothetical protein
MAKKYATPFVLVDQGRRLPGLITSFAVPAHAHPTYWLWNDPSSPPL